MERNALAYDDVLLIPSYNHYESRKTVSLAMTDRTGKLSLELPVITSNMDTITEHKMANFIASYGGIGVLHRYMSIEKNVQEFNKVEANVFVSVGTGQKEVERAEALRDAGASYFCIDVAHAHAKYVGRVLKELRDMPVSASCGNGTGKASKGRRLAITVVQGLQTENAFFFLVAFASRLQAA